MTKEQERSVEKRNTEERLQDLIDDIRRNKIKACELISEEGKYNLADDIETVLNMLKEKDKEMEKKDKIIDLMATFIDAQNIRMLEDEYTAIKNIYTIIGFDKDKEGIKQYFERKVKE